MAYTYEPCPCVGYVPDPRPDSVASETGCVPHFDVGRVAYWDAGSIPDSDLVTSSRLMATEDGTPTSAAGHRGNAWQINSGESLTTPDDSALRLVNTYFVVRIWYKTITLPGVNGDILTKLNTGAFTGWGIRITSAGALQFIIGNGSSLLTVNGPTVPSDAAFHHIVFTFNLATQTLRGHLDSVLTHEISNAQFTIASNTEVLRVGGGAAQPGHEFALDELAIWQSEWNSTCEVPADFECLDCDPTHVVDLAGLLSYWKLDELVISDIRQDSHSGNYDLTPLDPFGGPGGQWVEDGKIGKAVRDAGSFSDGLHNSNAAFGIVGPMTMTMWIRFGSGSLSSIGAQFIAGKYDVGASTGYMLWYNESGLVFRQANGGTSQEIESPFSLSELQWIFVVCKYDGTNQTIQINNGSIESQSGIVPSVAADAFSLLGTKTPLCTEFVGLIDEVSVWTRALSTTELSHLYNSYAGRTYPFA